MPASPIPKQDIRPLVQEMRRRLIYTTEQFAKRLCEKPEVVNQWQYLPKKPTKKTLEQLKKILLEMGDLGKDLLEEYHL
ncbi:MAG: hypothetical protein WCD18_27730 [Thermosynechococcaceae cyanobacterium]